MKTASIGTMHIALLHIDMQAFSAKEHTMHGADADAVQSSQCHSQCRSPHPVSHRFCATPAAVECARARCEVACLRCMHDPNLQHYRRLSATCASAGGVRFTPGSSVFQSADLSSRLGKIKCLKLHERILEETWQLLPVGEMPQVLRTSQPAALYENVRGACPTPCLHALTYSVIDAAAGCTLVKHV